jgi:hypothetical protein
LINSILKRISITVSQMLKRIFPGHFSFVSFILSQLLLIQVSFSIWSINRGFDFSDEAYGYLGFKYPSEVYHAFTHYSLLFDAFLGWINLSIINVRILRLLFILLCGSMFALGLIKWTSRKSIVESNNRVNVFFFILIGCFTINTNGSQSFTYNVFSTLIFQVIVGGFLYSFQRENRFNRLDAALYLSIGALLFALFMVKLPNAIFLSISLFLLLIFDKKKTKLIAIYSALMLLGCIIMSVVILRSSVLGWFRDYIATLF